MANDSPAKSLVDIDLASLRVSASPSPRCSPCVSAVFCARSCGPGCVRAPLFIVSAALCLLPLLSCKTEKIKGAEPHVLRAAAPPQNIHTCKVSLINLCDGHLCDFRTLLAFLSWWKWSAMARTDKYTRSVSF